MTTLKFVSTAGTNGLAVKVYGLSAAEAHRFVDLFSEIEDAREELEEIADDRFSVVTWTSHHQDIGPRADDMHVEGTTTGRFISKELRDETWRKIKAGERLGASHNSEFKPDYVAQGSLMPQTAYSPNFENGAGTIIGRFASKGMQDDVRLSGLMQEPTLDVDQHFTGEHVKLKPSTAPRWACPGEGNDDDNR